MPLLYLFTSNFYVYFVNLRKDLSSNPIDRSKKLCSHVFSCRKYLILYHKILNFTDLCYQEEITPQKGKWCEDNADPEKEYLNICDGSKTDCVLKGKEICHSDPNCHGIMYRGDWFGPMYKGVYVCRTRTLVAENQREEYSVYLKCSGGKF